MKGTLFYYFYTILYYTGFSSTYEEENWFRVEDISALKSFTSSLSNGMRERGLKNFLTNNMDLIMKAIRHGSQDTSQS